MQKTHQLFSLLKDPEIKRLCVNDNSIPYAINYLGDKTVLKQMGVITKEECDALVNFLRDKVFEQPLMPINDQSLIIFSNDNYRMIMNTDKQHGIDISVIKE